MKSYKYKFSTFAIILMIVGLLLSIGCIVLNLVRYISRIDEGTISTYDWISLAIILIISIVFIVIVTSMLISTKYTITDKEIVLSYGIIKNPIKISEIKEIKLHVKNKRLELIFDDESYFNIIIKEEWFEDFVNELKLKSSNIIFSQESENNDNFHA